MNGYTNKTDWCIIVAFCLVVLAMLVVFRYAADMKIENTKLKIRNEFLEQTGEGKLVLP